MPENWGKRASDPRAKWTEWLRELGATHRENRLLIHISSYETRSLVIGDDAELTENGKRADIQPPPDLREWIRANRAELVAAPVAEMPVPRHLEQNPPGNGQGTLYMVRDETGRLLYIRQRDDGPPKNFLTWTVQDGKWVCSPVPKHLPMYGNWHGRRRIMIHEGEKACDAAMSREHPWAEHLRLFGHASVPGANALPDLRGLRGVETWIVPDNDGGGEQGADRLAEALQGAGAKVRRLSYANLELPEGWDFADREHCRSVQDRAARNRIRWQDLRWTLGGKATVQINRGEGKPSFAIRPEFVSEFALVTGSKEIYERRRPLYPMTTDAFNHGYAHMSHVPDLARLLTKHPRLLRVDRAGYHPGRETGIGYKEEGFAEIFLNTHVPGDVQPRTGDIRPWLRFMQHLIPDRRERRIMLQWMCLVVGAPGERHYRFAPLLVSEAQGVGKTTIAEFLGFLIGHHNVSTLNTERATEKHNSWILSTRLLVVEELLETGGKFKLYEALKEIISNEHISVRPMGVQSYPFITRMAVLAFSNHRDALLLSNSDRRWFLPRITENKHYDFAKLRNWFYRQGGAEALLHAARAWAPDLAELVAERSDLMNGRHTDAPPTASKDEMLERTKSAWKIRLDDIAEELGERLIVLADLHQFLKDRERSVPNSPHVVADYLRSLGLIDIFQDRVSIRRGYTKVRIFAFKKIDIDEARHNIRWFTDEYKAKYADPITSDHDTVPF